MMDKNRVRARIESVGIIPAIRVRSADDARFAAEAVARAGIPIVEITMTVPGALQVIRELAASMSHVVVGAGTVLDVETAGRCLDAGAGFITSPGLDARTVEFAANAGVLTMPGVMTPTDIMAAVRAGADFVKVFPCGPLGGPAYLKAVSAPFADVPIVAAGGVDQRTAGEYIEAGATAVGIGAELIPRRAVHDRDERWILELAQRFLTIVGEARIRTGFVPPRPR